MSNYVKPTPMDRKYQNMSLREFNLNYQRDLMTYEQTKALETLSSNVNKSQNSYSYYPEKQKTINDYLQSIDTIMEYDDISYNRNKVKQLEKALEREKNKNKTYTKEQINYAKLCVNNDKIQKQISILDNDIKTIILFIMCIIYLFVGAKIINDFSVGITLGIVVTICWILINTILNKYISYLNNKYIKNIEKKSKLRTKTKK